MALMIKGELSKQIEAIRAEAAKSGRLVAETKTLITHLLKQAVKNGDVHRALGIDPPEQPAAETPAPAAEQPAAEQPAAETPAAETPAPAAAPAPAAETPKRRARAS